MAILLGTGLPSGPRGPVVAPGCILSRQALAGQGPRGPGLRAGIVQAVLALCTVWPTAAAAQGPVPVERPATVVHVTDGDTVWVELGESDQLPGGRVKVRIHGIDAPESCQAGGPEARTALAQRLQGRSVRIHLHRQDAYARWLGRLRHEGEDVGAWMVTEGWAWSYRFASGRGPYDDEEAQARAARRGLFAHPDPMPPWVFRQWHGPCR